MAIERGSRNLGDIALYLATASVIGWAIIFAASSFVVFLGPSRRPPLWFDLADLLVILATPILAIAAVITGHVARHRDRRDTHALVGLLMGYGMFAFVGLLVFTFWTIHST